MPVPTMLAITRIVAVKSPISRRRLLPLGLAGHRTNLEGEGHVVHILIACFGVGVGRPVGEHHHPVPGPIQRNVGVALGIGDGFHRIAAGLHGAPCF